MTYTLPKFSIPYFGVPFYAIPYDTTLGSGGVTFPYVDGEVFYLAIPTSGLPDYALPFSSIYGDYYYVTNPTLVSPFLYKAISDIYNDVYINISDAQSYLNAAVTHIASLDQPEPKVDLLRKFNDSKNTYANRNLYSSMYNAVSYINNHVQSRSNLSLDEWLTDNFVMVKSGWATMCESLGFAISESNIEN